MDKTTVLTFLLGVMLGSVAAASGSTSLDDLIYTNDQSHRVGIGTQTPKWFFHASSTQPMAETELRDGLIIRSNYMFESREDMRGATTFPQNLWSHLVLTDWDANTGQNAEGITTLAETDPATTKDFSYASIRGVKGAVAHRGSGTVNSLIGLTPAIVNLGSGTVTYAMGYRSYSFGNAGSGRIVNAYGIYLDNQTSAQNAYGIYQLGTDDTNYLEGKITAKSVSGKGRVQLCAENDGTIVAC